MSAADHVRRSNYAAELTDTKSEAGERRCRRTSRCGKCCAGSSSPALVAAKLAGIRWHDLRHHTLSALIAEGADIKLLQAVAGRAHHDDPRGLRHVMTERVEGAAKLYDPLREAWTG